MLSTKVARNKGLGCAIVTYKVFRVDNTLYQSGSSPIQEKMLVKYGISALQGRQIPRVVEFRNLKLKNRQIWL